MKTALITGSSRGIGKSIAKVLAANNYNIVINYYENEKGALTLKQELDQYNIKTMVIKADVSNEDDVKNMINYTIKEFETIDMVINNAGIARDSLFEDKTKEDFIRVLEVNLIGPFLITKYASKYMDNGLIINISSTDSVDTYNEYSIDYCASKAGLNSLTQTTSLALPHLKIISLLLPWVDTEHLKYMDKNYLISELEKNHQDKLYTPDEIALKIFDAINNEKLKTGDIIRL